MDVTTVMLQSAHRNMVELEQVANSTLCTQAQYVHEQMRRHG